MNDCPDIRALFNLNPIELKWDNALQIFQESNIRLRLREEIVQYTCEGGLFTDLAGKSLHARQHNISKSYLLRWSRYRQKAD